MVSRSRLHFLIRTMWLVLAVLSMEMSDAGDCMQCLPSVQFDRILNMRYWTVLAPYWVDRCFPNLLGVL